jgi:ribosomal protein S18 acetylase RimI-like enzyme
LADAARLTSKVRLFDQQLEIVEADLSRLDHQRDVVALTDAYARDPMGNGAPLSPEVIARLISGLLGHPTTLVLLAYSGGEAVGIATCFLGFSTFQGRPLVNVHDLAVLPEHRGSGVGRQLLEAVERKARALGCCKVTLEVLENNAAARRLYARVGFSQATYVETSGGALFYTKLL